MFKLITPTTENQLNKYYQFRWQMLREPWRMPVGSERDEYDVVSHHRMIVDSRGRPMAIGRLYITPDNDGQIRYMAVKGNRRSKGMGSLVLVALNRSRAKKVRNVWYVMPVKTRLRFMKKTVLNVVVN